MSDSFFSYMFFNKTNMVFDKLTVIFAENLFYIIFTIRFLSKNSSCFLCNFPKFIYVVLNQYRNAEREEYVIEICIFRKQNLQDT